MKKAEQKRFQKMLLVESEHLSKGLKIIGNDAIESLEHEKGGDLTNFAEAGTDSNDRETALRLASGESEMLRAVEEALQRIQDGTYGVCIDCDESIPIKRLEVFPAAQRCVECKSKFEKESAKY